jgi:hypothetical protein
MTKQTIKESKINPTYYQAGKCSCGKTLQTYDYVRHLPYADATAIKYITRHREKGGAIDIKKAIWFLQAILKDEYKDTE